MEMKATPREAKKSYTIPKLPLPAPTQKFKWIYKPVQYLNIDFRQTTHSTNLQFYLWTLLPSLRLLVLHSQI